MRTPAHTPHLDDLEVGLSPTTSHPAYVAVAPDWFWDDADPRAPFGSDDGNDTLRILEEHYREGGSDVHAAGAIANLIEDWDLVPASIWESLQDEIVGWLDADSNNIRFIHGEIDAYIAGALGQFKISVDSPCTALLGRTGAAAARARYRPLGTAGLRGRARQLRRQAHRHARGDRGRTEPARGVLALGVRPRPDRRGRIVPAQRSRYTRFMASDDVFPMK